MALSFLEFEQPIAELEAKIEELGHVGSDSKVNIAEEVARLQKKVRQLTTNIFASLTPWQITQLARHPLRPYTLDYLRMICDEFTELHGDRMFGDDMAIVGGLARIDGRPVAVMAGDPYHYAGAWTADTCAKVIRFVDLAETFHLPLVHLVDCPGFLIGLEAEKAATIRAGVRAMAAISQTTVPWCTILVRNVFGVAGAIHQPVGRLSLRYAWPSGYWGSLPLEGGIEAAYRADIDAAPDPQAKLAEIGTRLNGLRSPFRTAETFWVEEIIDPRDTRKLLCEFVRLAEPLLTPGRSAFTMRP